MRDRLDGVGVFVEAVEAGGFARAAERLALSRSAVSKTIARLEARLGTRLFHRTTRTQSLTEEGQLYYERCLKAIEELRTGETLIDSGRREVVGRLRVTMPVLLGRYCIAPLLLEFAQAHPKLELDLCFSDRSVDLVAERFDLAVRNVGLGQGNGLHTRRLAIWRKVLCASPAYIAARGYPATVVELVDHDALVHSHEGQVYPWRLHDADGQMTEIAPGWRLRFNDLEAIADATVAGLGLAWLPYWLVRGRVAAGDLVVLWGERPSATVDSYAVWPTTEYAPLRVRLAIDMLVAKTPGAVGE